jgi:flagellar basal body rod protein FlgC
MQAAQTQIEQSASRIASLPAAGNGGDSVDLSAEMVALLEGRNNFAANVKAQEVMDENTQSALDMVA